MQMNGSRNKMLGELPGIPPPLDRFVMVAVSSLGNVFYDRSAGGRLGSTVRSGAPTSYKWVIVSLTIDTSLIGGLEHDCYFSIYWEFHHPN